MIKGVDVSKHQELIDWNSVKKENVDFAIIRCGYGDNIESQDDEYFERNYTECKKIKIPIGVYLYSYADSIEHAKSEAEHVLRLMKNKSIEYPIFYDLEDEKTTGKCSNETIAQIAKTFCEIIANNGYNVGIYSNKEWFQNKLTDKIFMEYDKWVASYGIDNGNIPEEKHKYKEKHFIWQYTSKGKINGIKGDVDLNICFEEQNEDNNKPVPEKPNKIDVIYQTYTNGRWQPNVKNKEDYAGVFNIPVTGIYANLSEKDIVYKVHNLNGKWLPEVKNREDYAGIFGKLIDGVMMKSNVGTVKYRVHLNKGSWLPWVTGYDENDSNNGYAGVLGKEIDAIQVEII